MLAYTHARMHKLPSIVHCPSNSSGAQYQNVTTTGSRVASGLRGELNSLAN